MLCFLARMQWCYVNAVSVASYLPWEHIDSPSYRNVAVAREPSATAMQRFCWTQATRRYVWRGLKPGACLKTTA